MGFQVCYIVLFKSFAPATMDMLGIDLPGWCDNTQVGQIFWAVVFTLICFPVTLPRKLSEIRLASMFSVLLSIYVVLVIVFEALLNKGTSSSLSAGFTAGKDKAHISMKGIFGSLPLIIFSYMYQVNIPGIYQELEVKTIGNAKKIIFSGTALASVAYISAGIFGYVAFADGSTEAELETYFSDNALAAPWKNDAGNTPVAIYISLFGMMIVVTFAVPFCVLPVKDSIEEVRGRKFNKMDNVIWSVVIDLICLVISCAF